MRHFLNTHFQNWQQSFIIGALTLGLNLDLNKVVYINISVASVKVSWTLLLLSFNSLLTLSGMLATVIAY